MSLIAQLMEVLQCWGERKLYFMFRLLVNLYIMVAFLWQQERSWLTFSLQILLWELPQGQLSPISCSSSSLISSQVKYFATICPFCMLPPVCLSPFLNFHIHLCIWSYACSSFYFVRSKNSVIRLHNPHRRQMVPATWSLMFLSSFCGPLQAQALLAGCCWASWASGGDSYWPWKSLTMDILDTTLKRWTAPRRAFCENIE